MADPGKTPTSPYRTVPRTPVLVMVCPARAAYVEAAPKSMGSWPGEEGNLVGDLLGTADAVGEKVGEATAPVKRVANSTEAVRTEGIVKANIIIQLLLRSRNNNEPTGNFCGSS
jgi:hypothetical protein